MINTSSKNITPKNGCLPVFSNCCTKVEKQTLPVIEDILNEILTKILPILEEKVEEIIENKINNIK